jgi:hypothetical protein
MTEQWMEIFEIAFTDSEDHDSEDQMIWKYE